MRLQSERMLGYLIGGAAITGLCAAGYQSMAPTGQWFGRTFTGLEHGAKKLALTYDDGPSDPTTLELIEVLGKHDVHATFFMIGRYVQRHPDIARAVAAAGHVIGNHTFTHPNLIFSSTLQTRLQIEECTRSLTDAVGKHSRLFRPPFGGRMPRSLSIARSLQLEPIMWNVTGWDWNTPSAEHVEHKVSNQIRGGDVILLHDGSHLRPDVDRGHTVRATDRLIARYKAEGYEFVTIPEMMGKKALLSEPKSFAKTT